MLTGCSDGTETHKKSSSLDKRALNRAGLWASSVGPLRVLNRGLPMRWEHLRVYLCLTLAARKTLGILSLAKARLNSHHSHHSLP